MIDLSPQQNEAGVLKPCTHSTHPFVEFQNDKVECSIPDHFEQQVNRYPDRIAVRGANHILRYDALNKAANQVAQAILTQRGIHAEPIAILFEHDVSAIVAILGVLKAGKFYVPLDPTYPHTRNGYMLSDSGAKIILTNDQNLALAAEVVSDTANNSTCQVINIDELGDNYSDENVSVSILPDALSAIYYTSGSTGQPKGVLWNHRNALHHARHYTNDRYICPADKVGLSSSMSFAVSLPEMLGALLNGAALILFSVKENGLAQYTNWLTQQQITIIHPSVTFFRHFLDTLTEENSFPNLRIIALGGQRVSKRDVELFQKYFLPETVLIHQLASTEANFIARFIIGQNTMIDGDTVPVGYVVEDKEVLLLDDQGNEVGYNQVGEIAVRSSYLAPGYWQKPDLTQQVFIPDSGNDNVHIFRTGDMGRMRTDGRLEHLGRQDFQIKIRGYRVEPTEIETVLGDLGLVKEAVVVGHEDQTGIQRLVAYVVPMPQSTPKINTMRSSLGQKLPDYMIPSTFVILETLPRLPNGKLDYEALPKPDQDRSNLSEAYIAPEGNIEEMLTEIWQEVLRVERIGTHDDFFELGGHSLLAIQIISRIRDVFDIELPVNSLFEHPTIANLALKITLTYAEDVDEKELEDILAELEMLPDETQLP